MPRNTPPIEIPFAEALMRPPSNGQELEMLVMMMAQFAAQSAEHAKALNQALLGHVRQQRNSLTQAKEALDDLRRRLNEYQQQAWHPALYVGAVRSSACLRHRVVVAGRERLVMCAGEVAAANLRCGDAVMLGPDMNLIVAVAPANELFTDGQAATFIEFENDTHATMRVQHRDEERVLTVAQSLRDLPLKKGDLIRFRDDAALACGTLKKAEKKPHQLEQVPDMSPDRLGGLRHVYDRLMDLALMRFLHPEEANRYGLVQATQAAVLLIGPPGNGKTLVVRTLASQIQQATGKKTAFCLVQPAALQSAYVSVTESNTREFFQSVQHEEQAVIFLDEIDTIGRARGNNVNSFHHDRFLGSLLAEMEGFISRGNVIIIGATNCVDVLDAALRSRFRIDIEVPRPNRAGAAEILDIHLPKALPIATGPGRAPCDRASLIDAAVSAIYGGHVQPLARVHLADGKQRPVMSRDLVSGRLLADIAYLTGETAYRRHIAAGAAADSAEQGVTELDILSAIDASLQQLARSLTPRNIRDFVGDLPRDIQVVDVRPVARRVHQPLTFLNLAPLTALAPIAAAAPAPAPTVSHTAPRVDRAVCTTSVSASSTAEVTTP